MALFTIVLILLWVVFVTYLLTPTLFGIISYLLRINLKRRTRKQTSELKRLWKSNDVEQFNAFFAKSKKLKAVESTYDKELILETSNTLLHKSSNIADTILYFVSDSSLGRLVVSMLAIATALVYILVF